VRRQRVRLRIKSRELHGPIDYQMVCPAGGNLREYARFKSVPPVTISGPKHDRQDTHDIVRTEASLCIADEEVRHYRRIGSAFLVTVAEQNFAQPPMI
jgi:hypothetical protein